MHIRIEEDSLRVRLDYNDLKDLIKSGNCHLSLDLGLANENKICFSLKASEDFSITSQASFQGMKVEICWPKESLWELFERAAKPTSRNFLKSSMNNLELRGLKHIDLELDMLSLDSSLKESEVIS